MTNGDRAESFVEEVDTEDEESEENGAEFDSDSKRK